MRYAVIILLIFFVIIDEAVIILPTEIFQATAIQGQNDDDDDDDPGNHHHDATQPGHHFLEITGDVHTQIITHEPGQRVDSEANSGLIAFLSLTANKERAK